MGARYRGAMADGRGGWVAFVEKHDLSRNLTQPQRLVINQADTHCAHVHANAEDPVEVVIFENSFGHHEH